MAGGSLVPLLLRRRSNRRAVLGTAAVLLVGVVLVAVAIRSWRPLKPGEVPTMSACDEEDSVFVRKPGSGMLLEALLKDMWNLKAGPLAVIPRMWLWPDTRVLDTEMGAYTVVHNPVRSTKRRTKQSMPHGASARINMQQPFDPRAFHFGTVSSKEYLFVWTDDAVAEEGCTPMSDLNTFHRPVHAFLVNKSPLSKYSGLLLPYFREQRNQVLVSKARHALGVVLSHFAHS